MPASSKAAEPLRIAVVADVPGAASEIARALRHLGHTVCSTSLGTRSARARLQAMRPQVVLLRTGPRTFDLASAFVRSAAEESAALVVLTPGGSPQSTELARRVGALVHLIEPVPSQALVAAVHVAVARAGDLRDLRAELTRRREVVSSRPAVERAKAILMQRFGFTEEDAHRRLQLESRSRNRRLSETAWHVIRADAMLRARRRAQRSETARV
jgi:AmiR/NasT family two-component response regulator